MSFDLSVDMPSRAGRYCKTQLPCGSRRKQTKISTSSLRTDLETHFYHRGLVWTESLTRKETTPEPAEQEGYADRRLQDYNHSQVDCAEIFIVNCISVSDHLVLWVLLLMMPR